ncbi:MAG: hypothetical protein HN742_13030 [Lentisphaerae bacterium]|nr:hypothetical protein [Lentisphaerota bacterium]MBT7054947.1 hypothetical protein [Lentisphaerota bacterium]MBT7842794.1 hypothetical protein [Lentisphaerota bacterium]
MTETYLTVDQRAGRWWSIHCLFRAEMSRQAQDRIDSERTLVIRLQE